MKKTEYITIPQLARILGVSRIAVYKRVKNGRIKAVKIGRTFAVPQKQLMAIWEKPCERGQERN